MSDTPPPQLAERLARAGQAHVLAHWSTLDPGARDRLVAQLQTIDTDELAALSRSIAEPVACPDSAALEPAPVARYPLDPAGAARRRALGVRALEAGRVCCITVAGGQGTRLGLDGPKGAVPIGPASGRTLFDLFAAKIAATRARHRCTLPWLVMTSPANDAATRALFLANAYFGLDPATVDFFAQGTLPALDLAGRLVLEAPDRIFASPDGHGGIVRALARSGQLDRLAAHGVDLAFYFQVDNPLVAVADPVFLGEHLATGAEMSTKVVRKAGPDEKVGVLVRKGSCSQLVEYSDLDPALRQAREPDGALRFWAGNIATHAFDLPFLARVAAEAGALPLHLARKPVPSWTAGRGAAMVDGVKFERFVFDLLPLARATAALEVAREREFAPIKNASGVDSLASARAMLVAEYGRMLAAAGVSAPAGGWPAALEIDPAYALDETDLVRRGADEVARDLARSSGHLRA